MEYTLNMVFLTSTGKKTTFAVTGVKGTLTDPQINTLMNSLVTENIFTTSTGDLVKKDSATLVSKTVKEVTMA